MEFCVIGTLVALIGALLLSRSSPYTKKERRLDALLNEADRLVRYRDLAHHRGDRDIEAWVEARLDAIEVELRAKA